MLTSRDFGLLSLSRLHSRDVAVLRCRRHAKLIIWICFLALGFKNKWFFHHSSTISSEWGLRRLGMYSVQVIWTIFMGNRLQMNCPLSCGFKNVIQVKPFWSIFRLHLMKHTSIHTTSKSTEKSDSMQLEVWKHTKKKQPKNPIQVQTLIQSVGQLP